MISRDGKESFKKTYRILLFKKKKKRIDKAEKKALKEGNMWTCDQSLSGEGAEQFFSLICILLPFLNALQ